MRNMRGVTLIEIMVVAAVMVAVSMLVLKTYSAGSNFLEFSQREAALQDNARNALMVICADLMSTNRTAVPSAQSLVIPASPGNTKVTFFRPPYIYNATTGRVASVAVGVNGSVIWDTTLPVVYFYDAGNEAVNRTQNNINTTIVRNVDDLRFEDAGVNTTASLAVNEVRVSIALHDETARRVPVWANMSTVVKVRN